VTEADHSCKFTCICTVFELYMLAYIFPLENRNRRDTKLVVMSVSLQYVHQIPHSSMIIC